MAGVTWNYSENDFSSGKSPPLYNCLYSNVCVLTWTKCGRMNMLAQRNEKVYLCTRIWWKAPNEHNCAPECTENEPKCVMAVIGVPRLGLGSLPASTPPATLRSSRPPRLRDATTVMFESPFSPQSLCTRFISQGKQIDKFSLDHLAKVVRTPSIVRKKWWK